MFRLPSSSAVKLVFAAFSVFLAQAVSAAPVTFSGALSATDGFFNRPVTSTMLSTVGTHVAYDIFNFRVSADGIYTIETTAFDGVASDTFLALYEGNFDAASPLTNLLDVDDDSGSGSLSWLSLALQADTDYRLVLTTFSNDTFGAYSGRFDTSSGGGQVLLGDASEVPEPGTLALLPLSMLGLALARRLRPSRPIAVAA